MRIPTARSSVSSATTWILPAPNSAAAKDNARRAPVLVDGTATKACITKVGAMAGKRIVTIEGLAPNGKLHPVQQAFLDADALQCGYCTPGMILGAVALLGRTPNPSEAEIVSGMNGHICRCGTYPRVVRAIRSAAGKGGRA
jgi:aerobic-type carbon monoxide dehydrogenase small subunit (CoxS/CutS family)